jgi:hypothetical protein
MMILLCTARSNCNHRNKKPVCNRTGFSIAGRRTKLQVSSEEVWSKADFCGIIAAGRRILISGHGKRVRI